MDKEILEQYIDACELIKETEARIRKLEKKKNQVLQDSVKGSMEDFPYAAKRFHIEGTAGTNKDCGILVQEKNHLEAQKANAARLKIRVEEWMATISPRMNRIIRYKIFEENTWEQVARKMGRKATGESIRQEYRRFFEKR